MDLNIAYNMVEGTMESIQFKYSNLITFDTSMVASAGGGDLDSTGSQFPKNCEP